MRREFCHQPYQRLHLLSEAIFSLRHLLEYPNDHTVSHGYSRLSCKWQKKVLTTLLIFRNKDNSSTVYPYTGQQIYTVQ